MLCVDLMFPILGKRMLALGRARGLARPPALYLTPIIRLYEMDMASQSTTPLSMSTMGLFWFNPSPSTSTMRL